MRTSAILLMVLAVWMALLPPFFTHGECTAEFDAASDALQQARPALGTLARKEQNLPLLPRHQHPLAAGIQQHATAGQGPDRHESLSDAQAADARCRALLGQVAEFY